MLVVGNKEVEENTVSVRSRENAENETMDVDKFVERIKEEVANKTKQDKGTVQKCLIKCVKKCRKINATEFDKKFETKQDCP